MNHTEEIIKIIGSPFIAAQAKVTDETLERIYHQAFSDRVALLYLELHRKESWSDFLENKYQALNDRRHKTLDVIASLGTTLNELAVKDYAIFKSLKPYPATPNDTDVIIFGDKTTFKMAITSLYNENYFFHEWAPMQTTLIHPKGKGKIGKGKKGGTYYIDMYSDISTDYFLYIDKRSLLPHIETRIINGKEIQNVRKEIELAIILFHNVFPERTFQLEHFYMPLYHLQEKDFDVEVMLNFVRDQKLSRALSTNLTLVEHMHKEIFGFVPERIIYILDQIGRNLPELDRFIAKGQTTPYLISPTTFWRTFIDKIFDPAAFRSLISQGVHMLNPIFFIDVMQSLKRRFSERGTYHLE
ncbi:MAG: hypothetical protein COA36_16315 [Desulfotalea sp.]|nr:MAG: hypothetical protein COA36_16315 [Desulfotalea sp.]